MPHNPLGPICTAATVHFAAAVANFAWLETRGSPAEIHLGFSDSALFPVQVQLQAAHYVVPDAPGLGVEVNEDLVRQQNFRFWEAPHLRRRDGSVTNW
jgi:galactonate dehydratase